MKKVHPAPNMTLEERRKIFLKEHPTYAKALKVEKVRRTRDEARVERKRARAEEMGVMKRNGFTLHEIGLLFKIHRERVRQILKQYFPNEKFSRIKKTVTVHFNCVECGRKTKRSYYPTNSWRPRFCGRLCSRIHFAKEILIGGKPSRHPSATTEQKREYNRVMAQQYRKRKCHTPEYKARIKRYNQSAALKRKQKL